MTYKEWVKHMETTEKITKPATLTSDYDTWQKAETKHRLANCPDCQARIVTRHLTWIEYERRSNRPTTPDMGRKRGNNDE